MPYQRGQFWIRRFQRQAAALCVALAALAAPPPAPNFLRRALAHVAVHRLDRRPPVPVCRSAIPPVGLAGVSRSGRALCRAPPGGAARLRPHTQLLHGAGDALGLMLLAQEILLHGCQSRKNRPVPLWADRAAGAGTAAARRTHPPRRRRSPPATTTSPLPNAPRFRVDTLLDWALRYRHGGFEALAPQARQDRGQSRTITPQLADLIERLKRENPHRTGTTLLRELALSSGQNEPAISASTLYRFLKQRGLSERQLLAPPAHKKFEAEHSNQIWQSDMLFGPYVQRPGGGKIQAYLHAISR